MYKGRKYLQDDQTLRPNDAGSTDGGTPAEPTTRAVTLITGASSGIGLALAREFARQGHDLLLVARNLDRLEHLRIELSTDYGVTVFVAPLDLQEPDFWQELCAIVADFELHVEHLINNAGIMISGPAGEGDVEDVLKLTDVNIRAVMALMHCFVPGMVRRGRGTVLNVSSLSGLIPVPQMAAYSASKAYLISISKSVNRELRGTGVEVLVLIPGIVETNMHSQLRTNQFNFMLPAMSAAGVARVAYDGILAHRAIIVPGFLNMMISFGVRVLPNWISSGLVGWLLWSPKSSKA